MRSHGGVTRNSESHHGPHTVKEIPGNRKQQQQQTKTMKWGTQKQD